MVLRYPLRLMTCALYLLYLLTVPPVLSANRLDRKSTTAAATPDQEQITGTSATPAPDDT